MPDLTDRGTPPLDNAMNDSSLPVMFIRQAAVHSRKPLFWVKRDGRYRPITWAEALNDVYALAAVWLDQHIAAGDRILILSENRPEWGIADLAIQAVGAWTVPIYPSLTAPELLTIARDCQPVVCVVSTMAQADKVLAIQDRLPSLRLVLVMEGLSGQGRNVRDWTEALEQGRQLIGRVKELLDHRIERVYSGDIATIIYTSGTTGEPKGVLLSHSNFLSNAEACLRVIPITHDDVHLSFLPLSHVFERMAGWYLMLLCGASVAYAETMDTIPQNMLEIRPTVMLGVPRFFEKLYHRVQAGIADSPPLKRALARWALDVGHRAAEHRLAHRPLPARARLELALARRLVLKKLTGKLGGRLRFFVSGSAPLPRAIGEFFYDAGITILEGYGLTETSPVITVNRVEDLKFGSVGKPLDGVAVRIAEDGEILTRGPHVMQGYYQKPQETQAALAGGWFHTGDIGLVDGDGFLMITDRKKDLLKTAGGKFVAPQKLENLFITDPLIAQAFVYGDGEPFCVALLVPNAQRVADYARTHQLPVPSPQELLHCPAVKALLWSRVQALQQDLASFEQVKAVGVLDHEFSQASGELTPTLKSKRAVIAAHYRETLKQLYASAAHASPASAESRRF